MAPVVVTDSTGMIPAAVRDRFHVPSVPLRVVFGDESYRDGVDIHPDEFYRKLAAFKGTAGTTQPSPGDFVAVFQPIAQEGRDIVCVTISSRLSGTYNSALQAAELVEDMFDGVRIAVVDSRMASAGHGLLALKAAERAAEGASVDEILAALDRLRLRIVLLAVVDTLEYLIRGGRVGRARGLVGKILGLHPLLTLVDGEVDSPGVVRSRRAGLQRIEEETERRLTGEGRRRMVVIHADAEDEAREWAERIRDRFRPDDLWIEPFTPVLGVHTGPGLLGLVSCEDPEAGAGGSPGADGGKGEPS
ncbi:MAG: DegV family protein [Firmicutes bacterium]|nr:DegV family protein [Bacillota bacterium]MBE3590893.1 DegV family protein [Bacillota bacterium]